MELSERTIERWRGRPEAIDGRKGAPRTVAHAFTAEEKATFLGVANSAPFRDDSPPVIISKLADEGTYLGSESTLYRLLKTEDQLHHRTNSAPRANKRPDALEARGSNEVWTWDITYIKTLVRGCYYYLYLHVDIFSRKIIGAVSHSLHEALKGKLPPFAFAV